METLFLKAFTLTQPWASLIALFLKTFETRSWKTSYRGPLLIHASRQVDKRFVNSRFGHKYNMQDLWTPDNPIPTMAIVALCNLTGCVPTQPLPEGLTESDYDLGDWSEDRWAWKLTDIQPLDQPVPCRGAMSVWTPSSETMEAVCAALNRTQPPNPGSFQEREQGLRLPQSNAAATQSKFQI